MVWAKPYNVGVWTDASNRYLFDAAGPTLPDYARIYKSSTNNRMSYRYRAGGVTLAGDEDSLSITDWMCLFLTWSKTEDEVAYWRDGAAADVTDTGLGTWTETLNTNKPVIGAANVVPGLVWNGWLGPIALWGRVPTDGEIQAASLA